MQSQWSLCGTDEAVLFGRRVPHRQLEGDTLGLPQSQDMSLRDTAAMHAHIHKMPTHGKCEREREGESERLRRVEREIYPSNELCTNVDGLQSEAYRRAALWQPRLQLTNNGRLTATWRASLRKAAERPAAPPGAGTLWLGRGRSWPCPAYPRAEKAPLES